MIKKTILFLGAIVRKVLAIVLTAILWFLSDPLSRNTRGWR